MSFEIDRADMKLLIECGYSAVSRGQDVDCAAIFGAIDEWMPDYAAGEIGFALMEMSRGELDAADARLSRVIASDRVGRDEARAMLAMCKVLRNEAGEAERLAQELAGTGGHAEEFTSVLVYGVDKESPDDGQVIMAPGSLRHGVGDQQA